MKVLVIQVKIDDAAFSMPGYEQAHLDFKKYLVPSVERYCDKYGYDYMEITDYPKDIDVKWFTTDKFNPPRNIASAIIRYHYMHNENYDAVVSLDNDVYITSHAEPLPVIIGHMAVDDINMDKKRKKYDALNRFLKRINTSKVGVINSGVQMVDSEVGLMIKKFMDRVCEKQIHPLEGYYCEQNYINYFRSKFPDKCNLLEPKWNYMASRYEYTDYSDANFVHFCGPTGRKLFYRDLNNGLIENASSK
jgi:hypothetical protein